MNVRVKARLFAWSLALPIAAGAGSGPLDFELAGASGFVRLSHLPPQPTLINFWRSDCAPCVREMPLLAEVARGRSMQVLTVALQRPSETLAAPEVVLRALQAPVQALYAPAQSQGLLTRFGNSAGSLPHTVVLDSSRMICAMRSGEIDRTWIEAALSRCARQ